MALTLLVSARVQHLGRAPSRSLQIWGIVAGTHQPGRPNRGGRRECDQGLYRRQNAALAVGVRLAGNSERDDTGARVAGDGPA